MEKRPILSKRTYGLIDFIVTLHLQYCDNFSKINAMNWRFFPTLNPQVYIIFSRDPDSEISAREVLAVEEWMLSDKQIHAMLDHIFHAIAMLGDKNWNQFKISIYNHLYSR